MSEAKRKRLRNIFWLLFVVLTVACVPLNIQVRNGVSEDEYEQVSVRVVEVKEVYSGRRAAQYSNNKTIHVTVSYQGQEYKLKGAVDYNKFQRLKGSNYDALLYKGNLYYDLPSVKTASPMGIIYFTCLGADAVCLFAALALSGKKKK